MKYSVILLLFVFVINPYFFNPAVRITSKNSKALAHIQPISSVTEPTITVKRKWELPGILKEISALCFIDKNRFACVQDEEGIVFIYNIEDQRIEKQIKFSGPGDYEGVALANNFIYILRSDGHIFETDAAIEKTNMGYTNEYATSLTVQENIEGLCFDKENNRLLLAIKAEDARSRDYKGIYSFDLSSKKFVGQPLYRIDLSHSLFNKLPDGKKKNKKSRVIQPTGITVHPLTGDLYITDGPGARLLILDKTGKIKFLVDLGKKDFPQAEGITFNDRAEMFISNEGKKEVNGNIVQVAIQL